MTSFLLILLVLSLIGVALGDSQIDIPFHCLLNLYPFVHEVLYFL